MPADLSRMTRMTMEELNDMLAFGDENDHMLSDYRKRAKNELFSRFAALARVAEKADNLTGEKGQIWSVDPEKMREVREAIAAITFPLRRKK